MPDDDYNSGIGFRCTPAKGKPKGYQCEVAGAITPVPGGVGPMTIACLLHNTLQQACRLNGIEVPE
jgi:hypothetical protein